MRSLIVAVLADFDCHSATRKPNALKLHPWPYRIGSSFSLLTRFQFVGLPLKLVGMLSEALPVAP